MNTFDQTPASTTKFSSEFIRFQMAVYLLPYESGQFHSIKGYSRQIHQKISAKIPLYPRYVLPIQLVVPPTAKRFISFNQKWAQAFLDHIFENRTLDFKMTYSIHCGELIIFR